MTATIEKLRDVYHEYVDALNDDYQQIWIEVQSLVLTPLRLATSPTAIKAYLSAFLFFTTSLTLVGVSSSAYFVFYYLFIPQINLEEHIYFQYGPDIHPHAIIPLQTTALISQQQYDIQVVLHMPRTPTNLAAGNFMLDLSLLNDKSAVTTTTSYTPRDTSRGPGQSLYRARRPTILPFSSYMTSLSYSILHLPSHLLKLRDLDSATLVVPLFEKLSFPRGRQNIPTHAYLEIQSQLPLTAEACPSQAMTLAQGLNMLPASSVESLRTIQVYSAKLNFRARFKGLRYVVYNYRVISFLVFSTMFYGFALFSMGVAWFAFSTRRGENAHASTSLKSEGGHRSKASLIKSENDTRALSDLRESGARGSDHSSDENDPGNQTDSSTTFPGIGRTVAPLRYPGSSQYDSGELVEAADTQRDDGTNDAEDEDDPTQQVADIKQEDDEELPRFADSGIGTSMESEQPGSSLVRRRSGRRT